MADNPVLNDRYRLIENVGSGGMAVLYKAQDLELGRIVAVKVLRQKYVSDPEFLLRFRREARAVANLSHPNIVTVHDVGQDGASIHYIVMEYVPGQNLKQLILAQGAFEVDAALAITIEVCKGVGYAHRAGLAHCDIKPQNILVTPDHRIKVVDFGIARALSTGQGDEDEEVVWGSPHYFSPEQATGSSPTPASDVYSIGVVLFELLTGHLPFTGANYQELAMAHYSQEPPSLTEYNPALPQELDRIVRKVLSKEPSTRYRTADQLGRILHKYTDEGQQPTTSFVIHPSTPAQEKAQEPARAAPEAAPPPPGLADRRPVSPNAQPTIPGLPPLDMEEVFERQAAQRPTLPPDYDVYDEYGYDDRPVEYMEDVPGVDIYGIALGVLAAVAWLGLIPLWVTVYLTFSR
nr:serine/threonine protein kinase [Anaerolineae bacterium]